jgi:hypothetical protein
MSGEKFPYDISQNPAPTPESGQDYDTARRELTNAIMQTFFRVLPSNYVSVERGPWYTLQFQAIAEQLAAWQIAAQEVYKDSTWDFTRPEFLWEILGRLVFPASSSREGFPQVNGDIECRDFLRQMVLLLLAGATAESMQQGAELLTDASAILIEKFLHSVPRDPAGLWTIDNQFEVEIFIESEGGTAFPADPFNLQTNAGLILDALKPAHVLYEYRFLFREVFGPLFTDEVSWTMSQYHYDDLRKYCYGAREITGTAGETLTDRFLFTDTTKSLGSVQPGAILRIDAGVNAGTYEVVEVRVFPLGTDTTARAYTTSPTGLTGTATVSGDTITDSGQDFGAAVEGEVLTFTAGPNAGSYRLETLLGSNGGLVGFATGPATQVRPSPCILRVSKRMPAAATGQTYLVDVDRLGMRTPKTITNEDASEQFYL